MSDAASAATSASLEVGAVVDGCRAELDREAHAVALAELVAVHAHAEARGRAGLEHAARLLGRERAALAERVDPARVRRARREHLADDEVDVGVGAAAAVDAGRRTRPARRARRGR